MTKSSYRWKLRLSKCQQQDQAELKEVWMQRRLLLATRCGSTQELIRNAESQPLTPKHNMLFNKAPSDLKAHSSLINTDSSLQGNH